MRTTFRYHPTAAEYREGLLRHQRRLFKQAANRWLTLVIGALAAGTAAALMMVLIGKAGPGAAAGPWLALFVGISLVLAAAEQMIKSRNVLGWIARRMACDATLTLDDGGLRVVGKMGTSFLPWSALEAVEVCGRHLFISLGGVGFILLPASAFADEAERDSLAAHLNARRAGPAHDAAAPERAAPAAPGPAPADAAPRAGAWRNLGDNLVLGLRLLFFLRPTAGTPRASWSQFIALALIALAIPLAIEAVRIGPSGTFAWYALPGALFFIPVLLLAAWALAAATGRAGDTLSLLTALAGLFIPLIAFEQLAQLVFQPGWIRLPRSVWPYLRDLWPFWLAAAATLAAIRLFGVTWPRRPALAILATLLVASPLTTVFHDAKLWVPAYDEDAEDSGRRYKALSNEDTFYLQPKLLEARLAQLEPGRKGQIDLYFVGMAGYSGQDVFMKEVQSVAALFRERFGTGRRSVTLINNAKTVADTPIASGTSLRLTLKRIAEVMDPDEDILFLFMTSHGSKDHKFSLDFWPMHFNPLDPRRLRQILDESGIRRRVIVVSACYSGGFVDALRDDHTLVIAASAPDRNSFGCDSEAEFTYFGKAYFDEALRETDSFIEAFDRAKPRIAERERQEDYTPSDPRIAVGSAILEPLAALTHQRRAVAAAAKPAAADAPDIYDTYFATIGLAARIRRYRDECRREMEQYAPEVQVARNLDAYGGLRPGSPHWPQLASAWRDYADDWCQAANDEVAYRRAFRDAWQARAGERDLRAAIALYSTPAGRRVLDVERAVEQSATATLAEARGNMTRRALARLQGEQERIVALHQKSEAAQSQRRTGGRPAD